MIVFIDANIILSGIFFSGPEAKFLSKDIKLRTADICYKEAIEACEKKFKQFNKQNKYLATQELKKAFLDIKVVNSYEKHLDTAKKLIDRKKDQKVLAAALKIKPDYFLSGDKDFDKPKIREKINLIKTRELLKKA